MNYFEEAVAAMKQLYSKDIPMSLATVRGGKPNARFVDLYFDGASSYLVTTRTSQKCEEIKENPMVALNYQLFVAHGVAYDIGSPLNHPELREVLRKEFAPWYAKHVDENNPDTCIIKIALTDAIVFLNGMKYKVDFSRQEAARDPFAVDIIF